MKGINLVEEGIAPATPAAGGAEMMEQNLLHLVGLDIRIAHDVAVGGCHVDERHLVAGTDAGDGLDANLDTQCLASLHHGCLHLCCSTCLATVFHTYANLALHLTSSIGLLELFLRLHRLKVGQHLPHAAGLHMPENPIVNLHNGGQGTTAEAGHAFDGVLSIGGGDFITFQL